MHCNLIEAMGKGSSYRIAEACCRRFGKLVVFAVNRAPELVFVDSREVRTDFDGRLAGTGVVCPAQVYDVMHNFSEKVRDLDKAGIVYPSARHSRDVALALFGDKTGLVKDEPYLSVDVDLRLIPEECELNGILTSVDPFEAKVHPTLGYFEFQDAPNFEKMKIDGLLVPEDVPRRGITDFVRRQYAEYPRDAVATRISV